VTGTSPGFRIAALSSALAAWALVAVGGIVRVTESGLGCPDWPLCDGRAVPRGEKTAMLEYSHRAVAFVVSALVLLVAGSAVQTARFYWDGSVQSRDWHRSFNDEMYDAAKWLESNVPEDAVVGSWNSGILGFYARQPVVNLDGILNDYEILPYLERREIAKYIEREDIRYLSEAEPLLCRIAPEVLSELELKKIYSSPLPLFRTKYVIYEVLGPRRAPAGDETVACRGVESATLPPR